MQKIWPLIDRENLENVPLNRFKSAVKDELGFFASAGVLAEFLDTDKKGYVCCEDLQQLRRFGKDGRSLSFGELDDDARRAGLMLVSDCPPKATSHFHAAHSQFNDHAKSTTMSHQQQRQALVDPMPRAP
eukprot:s6010_g1.t1